MMWVFVVSVVAWAAPAAQALSAYNAWGGYAVGDSRIISLGGADLADSSDINVLVFNPAGIAFAGKPLVFGFARSHVTNKPADLTGDGKTDGLPQSYLYLGAVGLFPIGSPRHPLAVGAGYTVPFEAGISEEVDNAVGGTLDLDVKFRVSLFSLPVAYRIRGDLAAGISINYFTFTERFSFSSSKLPSLNVDVEQSRKALAVDGGVMWKPHPDWSFGAVYRPSVRVSMDETVNQDPKLTQLKVLVFRDMVIPWRAGLGTRWKPQSRLTVLADANYIDGQSDSVLVGSELAADFSRAQTRSEGAVDAHAGLEYRAPILTALDLVLRAGTYLEPLRTVGVEDRVHGTGGIQIDTKWVVAQVGVDRARDFSNLTWSLRYVF